MRFLLLLQGIDLVAGGEEQEEPRGLPLSLDDIYLKLSLLRSRTGLNPHICRISNYSTLKFLSFHREFGTVPVSCPKNWKQFQCSDPEALVHEQGNKPPISLSRLIKFMKGKEDKIAVIVEL
ncbi:hypothetical protein SDJN03_08995, partial [Cucurbita argyrosperma subsp. sororia]